ncbi:MAG: hypothetical protein IPG53_06550 [Ignavibacteriales bacterium]|nr:hypothetical protein [Ignavibacteriales bacterium]
MISALGKNGQILNIVPELNLVTVRMGDAPGSAIEVPTLYNNDIWKILKQVIRYTPTSVKEEPFKTQFNGMVVYPNPATDRINFSTPATVLEVDFYIYSVLGEKVAEEKYYIFGYLTPLPRCLSVDHKNSGRNVSNKIC